MRFHVFTKWQNDKSRTIRGVRIGTEENTVNYKGLSVKRRVLVGITRWTVSCPKPWSPNPQDFRMSSSSEMGLSDTLSWAEVILEQGGCLTQYDWCPYKKKQTPGEKMTTWQRRQTLGQRIRRPGNAQDCQHTPEARRGRALPYTFQGKHGSAAILASDVCPQNCETSKLCCFKLQVCGNLL